MKKSLQFLLLSFALGSFSCERKKFDLDISYTIKDNIIKLKNYLEKNGKFEIDPAQYLKVYKSLIEGNRGVSWNGDDVSYIYHKKIMLLPREITPNRISDYIGVCTSSKFDDKKPYLCYTITFNRFSKVLSQEVFIPNDAGFDIRTTLDTFSFKEKSPYNLGVYNVAICDYYREMENEYKRELCQNIERKADKMLSKLVKNLELRSLIN